MLTWKYSGNGKTVGFEMEAGVSSADSYTAFALSEDQKMVSILDARIPVGEFLDHRRAARWKCITFRVLCPFVSLKLPVRETNCFSYFRHFI